MKEAISFKNINKLAIPAFISGVSEPILSLTDVAIIGNIKENPTASLAAVGIVASFLSMLIWVLGQSRSALSSIVSQYLGANKLDEIKNLPAQTIYIITFLGFLLLAATYPFATFIFQFYNASGTILDFCVEYYQIRVFGFPFTLFTIAVFGTFRGLQNTFYPMLVAVFGTVINLVLDVVFVFGIDSYLAPMNLKGAALASVIAQIAMALLAAYLLLKKSDVSLKFQLPLHFESQNFAKMILNLFVRTLALNVTLYLGTSYATAYGDAYIAAYTIAINLWFLGAFIIDGYSSAGNILAGKLYGAKQYGLLVRLSTVLIQYGLALGLFLSVVGFVFYKNIGLLFTKDQVVLAEFQAIFWIVLAMQPICSLAFIFDGIFKGLGKMKTLRNVLLMATFLVFTPCLLLLDYFEFKLKGVFIAVTIWIVFRSFPLIFQFRKEFVPLSKE